MKILDSIKIDKENTIYTVALEPGFVVDVKANSKTGLAYVMQNEDGSTVYDQAFSGSTYPGYKYDEKAVLRLIKENSGGTNKEIKRPALEELMESASTRVRQQARQAMDTLDKQIAVKD